MTIPLETSKYYHIYNRGNNRESLFYTPENYDFFLSGYKKHCFHVLETYAYCLMNNHFHMLVSVRPTKIQENLILKSSLQNKNLQLPSKHLSNFFSSYTQSLNRQQNRSGSLFQKNFKREVVDSEEYFLKMVTYIHLNPLKHGFTDRFEYYPYSSYPVYLHGCKSFINCGKTIDLFGGLENFIFSHDEEKLNFGE